MKILNLMLVLTIITGCQTKNSETPNENKGPITTTEENENFADEDKLEEERKNKDPKSKAQDADNSTENDDTIPVDNEIFETIDLEKILDPSNKAEIAKISGVYYFDNADAVKTIAVIGPSGKAWQFAANKWELGSSPWAYHAPLIGSEADSIEVSDSSIVFTWRGKAHKYLRLPENDPKFGHLVTLVEAMKNLNSNMDENDFCSFHLLAGDDSFAQFSTLHAEILREISENIGEVSLLKQRYNKNVLNVILTNIAPSVPLYGTGDAFVEVSSKEVRNAEEFIQNLLQ